MMLSSGRTPLGRARIIVIVVIPGDDARAFARIIVIDVVIPSEDRASWFESRDLLFA
jgi:hypothetical protein